MTLRLAREPDIDVHIGRQLRRRRHALGVSQDALAEAIGVGFQQVQKYELGVNRLSASALARRRAGRLAGLLLRGVWLVRRLDWGDPSGALPSEGIKA